MEEKRVTERRQFNAADREPMPNGTGEDVVTHVKADLRSSTPGALAYIDFNTLYRDVIGVAATLRSQLPDAGEDIAEAMAKDAEDRVRMGEKKYGVRLKTNNGRNVIMDAYQEALDLLNYLRQARLEGKL